MRIFLKGWSAPHFLCCCLECLDLQGYLVLFLALEGPCHAVHLMPDPSLGDVQSPLSLLLGCHSEVSTSQQ